MSRLTLEHNRVDKRPAAEYIIIVTYMKTKKNTKRTKNTNSQSGFTMVRTGYARAAMLLLALNLCFTAYAFARLNEYMDQRLEATETGSSPELLEVAQDQ